MAIKFTGSNAQSAAATRLDEDIYGPYGLRRNSEQLDRLSLAWIGKIDEETWTGATFFEAKNAVTNRGFWVGVEWPVHGEPGKLRFATLENVILIELGPIEVGAYYGIAIATGLGAWDSPFHIGMAMQRLDQADAPRLVSYSACHSASYTGYVTSLTFGNSTAVEPLNGTIDNIVLSDALLVTELWRAWDFYPGGPGSVYVEPWRYWATRGPTITDAAEDRLLRGDLAITGTPTYVKGLGEWIRPKSMPQRAFDLLSKWGAPIRLRSALKPPSAGTTLSLGSPLVSRSLSAVAGRALVSPGVPYARVAAFDATTLAFLGEAAPDVAGDYSIAVPGGTPVYVMAIGPDTRPLVHGPVTLGV